MGRPQRIQSEQILFHVINRGNAKQTLFYDDADRRYILELLRRYKFKYGVRVYHYVLMNNHIHLLIEPTNPHTISKFMQGITGGYARYFNKKRQSMGHVWQSRFRCIPIETDSYYVRCAQYIELNPVRAAIVGHPDQYEWSSYKQSVLRSTYRWLDIQPLLLDLQKPQTNGVLIYDYMMNQEIERIHKKKSECLTQFAIYGGTDFMAKYAPMLDGVKPDTDLTQA